MSSKRIGKLNLQVFDGFAFSVSRGPNSEAPVFHSLC